MTGQLTSDWWPFERRMLKREQLVVERYDGTDGYQRSFRQRFVDAAVQRFEEVLFDAIKVAEIIDGRYFNPERAKYAVLDGQHREGMAEALAIEWVPCDVYRKRLDYEQRALTFYKLNRNKQLVNITDGTRSLYEGRDDDILDLLYLLERHGFYLNGYRPVDANGHRPLHAIQTLRKAHSANANALDVALDVLQPWQPLISRRVEKVMIEALMLWCRRSDVDLDRLRGILEEHGPDYMWRDAGEEAARTGHVKPTGRNMANTLLGYYNNGLRTRRINDAF